MLRKYNQGVKFETPVDQFGQPTQELSLSPHHCFTPIITEESFGPRKASLSIRPNPACSSISLISRSR